ncbi:ATP-dependent endonuclease [Bosea sp. 62]|uniref:ATP-dependent nuclease n=1 Tax=unclassified Bosea (in: a-proteobacteria) TaxID=2653178 RepID=UPI001255F7E6|nr:MULTISPECIES: ATP-binding protein [unclassified Bosea (in: a-proteobacteria)]CAD5291711.1 ATP-dependent endonuclease [Bosea sp. 21B]CAD5292825.1 ATP-dependent endonuclease [Bosea sp. 46]CAD5299998.1 ATP-dependent endonuclease [Bosea sp. 7B]VVT57127.1 ATP-dependent endonuclease [Bosea sp. EC-HK365B]VXB49502.1 ATP-dependent endonuclease [Bosea sp. 127]
MALVRVLEIENFRAVKSLRWLPGAGINCLIGPGDSGKSTILDAIDLCLGARRSLSFTDADFHALDFSHPIRIALTLGALDDPLKNLDAYGDFLVGFDVATGAVEPEPGAGLETALTLQLTVQDDLEPEWTLVSPRAQAAGRTRNLNWADRTRIAPARLGATSDAHLTWRRGSVLTKLTDGKTDASKELTRAAREMRDTFDQKELKELEEPLKIVKAAAGDMGVPVGAAVQALIDAGSVTFTGGTISLHDEEGVPLRALGLGSSRLLIAALQRKAAENVTTFLIDELEYGLEPHRIIRLLGALGAKEENAPLQVFATSHSPITVAELSAHQLYIVRENGGRHTVTRASDAGNVQGTIRAHAHALLASSIVVCEGGSEVGLMRGLDQYFTASGETSLSACGATLVNGNGDETFSRAIALQSLGYRTAILRDSDKPAPAAAEAAFIAGDGTIFAWGGGRALEQELFAALPDGPVSELLELAIETKDRALIEAHIKTISRGAKALGDLETEALIDGLSPDSRAVLGNAAARFGWLKTISTMETAGRTIVGPCYSKADASLTSVMDGVLDWVEDGSR